MEQARATVAQPDRPGSRSVDLERDAIGMLQELPTSHGGRPPSARSLRGLVRLRSAGCPDWRRTEAICPRNSARSGVRNLDCLRRARPVRDLMDFWRVNIDVLLRYLRLQGLQGTWVGLRFGGSVPPEVGAQTSKFASGRAAAFANCY